MFISAFAWRFIYNNPYGFLDQFLQKLGWHDPPAFLGDPTWAKVAVITTNVWLGVPFMMVALLGGLQAIDTDLLDAALVDGANVFRRFWDVTLPGLRPVAATVILLGLIWTFNMFNIIFLITGGGPANATQIFPTFAYRAAFTDYLYGQAAAWGVIILSMLLVFGTGYRWLVAGAARRPGREHARRGHPRARQRRARPRRRARRAASAGRAAGGSGTCRCSFTASLIFACVIAIFPVLWILISSFKPPAGDRGLDHALDPAAPLADLELHPRPHRRPPHLPDVVLELDLGRVLHDGDRRLPRGDRGVRVLALPLPRLPRRR